MNKPSLGNGYGLHRGMKGESAHGLAKPVMKNVTVKPGFGKITPGSPKTGVGTPKRKRDSD